MTAREPFKPWSEADQKRLEDLVHAKWPWEEIGRRLGRTAIACKVRFHAARRGSARVKINRVHGNGWTARRASDEAAAAARELRTHVSPRTLTAEIFGDPLPGRSALDRRLAHAPAPRITLPNGAERSENA